MTRVFFADPVSGKVALFTENGTGGDYRDPAADRNAPLLDPADHLDLLRFHSDLDHFEAAATGTTGVSYTTIAGLTAGAGTSEAYGTYAGSTDDLVYTHSLGYEPFALVSVGGNILWPGMPVQIGTGGAARYATAYVTTTELRVATQATIGATDLSSTTIDYDFLIFKAPPAADGSGTLFHFDPATGAVTMGLGKFDSSRRYLQVVPGGSPLGMAMGKTVDLNNGAPRAYNPDGTYLEPVPATLKFFLPFTSYGGGDFGSEPLGSGLGYGGSYAGPSAIQVQAP